MPALFGPNSVPDRGLISFAEGVPISFEASPAAAAALQQRSFRASAQLRAFVDERRAEIDRTATQRLHG